MPNKSKNAELMIVQSDDGLIADLRSVIEQTREGVARSVSTPR